MKKSILRLLYTFLAVFVFLSCSGQKQIKHADMIIKGGTIYTVDEKKSNAEAVAIKGNKIIFVGKQDEAMALKSKKTKIIELEGKTMIPGFIDAHGHFMGMGHTKTILDLAKAKSFNDIINMVAEAVKLAKPGEWIEGRGWHQDKWSGSKEDFVGGFPTHHQLSKVSPKNPVFFRHASGHGSMVNNIAMVQAGINKKSVPALSKMLEGGEIVTDKNGEPTGILNETAQRLIWKILPADDDPKKAYKIIDLAIEECHRNGITGFHDAGINQSTVNLFMEYKKAGKLKVRLHTMLRNNPVLLEKWFDKGPIIDTIDYLLNVRSVKVLIDGALGNRGAWLLDEYSDKPGWFGLETTPREEVKEIAENCLKSGFQLCIHAIGDRGNREVLDIYENAFNNQPKKIENHRFRVEHAQHLHLDDIPRFANLKVIAAMQAIHMSSDRPWAIDRLGEKRIKEGAYVWQKLLQSGAVVMNGTDVPVEPVSPIECFYASVSRKTLKGTPEGGYEPEQKMTREQALKSYTLSAAYGSFEENVKGSIEVGKLADFAILDSDIMTIPEDKILNTKVVMTIFNGEIVYNSEK